MKITPLMNIIAGIAVEVVYAATIILSALITCLIVTSIKI
jgi:hypothetical protein